MVIDRLENIAAYAGLGENFAKAIAFLQKTDLSALPLERFELDGRELFGFVKQTELETENLRWEAHRKYADIQLIVAGAERIGFAPYSGEAETVPFSQEGDIGFYQFEGAGTDVTLNAGDFAIFLPGELHRPDCPVGGKCTSRKMVIKVAL